MFRGSRQSARSVLFLVVVLVVGLAVACGGTGPDEAVRGPAWRTALRTGIGAATSANPARLAGIDVDERGEFDRILIGFDGPLPGYCVGYGWTADPADADHLTIVLQRIRADGERVLDLGLPAIDQIRRTPSSGGTVRATVTLRSGSRLPFRVGISPGAFYVDVAHPGAAAGVALP